MKIQPLELQECGKLEGNAINKSENNSYAKLEEVIAVDLSS